MFNRTTAPVLGKPNPNNIVKPELLSSTGLPIYYFNIPGSNVIQLDFVFNAGLLHQKQPLIAQFTYNLLLKGTKQMSAVQIMDELDSLGAYISESVALNHTRLTVYCLDTVLDSVLNLLMPSITGAIFPEEELVIKVNKGINQLKINQTKTSYNAKRVFNEVIYGKDHALGHSLTPSDYINISRETLLDFKDNHINLDNCYVVVSSGNKKALTCLSKHIGEIKVQKDNYKTHSLKHTPDSSELTKVVHVDNAVQATVYLGKQTINCNHQDFNKLHFVNTLLGGYFGSRLMTNIREEKGLTYGIHSSIINQEDIGLFQVSSDIKKGKHQLCLDEIDKEIHKLQNEKVSQEELEKVKNYLLGAISKSNSDATSYNTSFIGLKTKGLDYSYLENKIQSINEISADDVLQISNTYLQTDTLTKVTALNTK